nr:carbon storage regulator [Marinomonas sp. A3A]
MGGFGAGEAHGQKDEAVAGDAVHRASLVLFIFVVAVVKLNISRKGGQVRVGVTASKDVTVHREEIYKGIKE